jgi:hypothetical protein
MASALYQQIDNVEAIVAALTPTTDATDTFVLSGTDLPIDREPGHRPRIFTVYPDPSSSLTRERFGTTHRQATARFVVEVLCDSRADERARDQRMVEDRDQIIGAVEAPGARINADVQQVVCVDSRIEANEQGHATRLLIVFECLYLQAL